MGTSKQLSLGPDALSSLLIGTMMPEIPIEPTILFPLFAFTTGIFLLLFGFLRIGFIDNILSRPLLSGFINAVALTILFEQFENMFGLVPSDKHGWEKFIYSLKNISHIHVPTFLLGLLFLSILFIIRYFKSYHLVSYVPETFVVIITGILIITLSDLKEMGVRTIGHIQTGFAMPSFPGASFLVGKDALQLFSKSLLISLIGFIEHIVIAKSYSTKHNYPISANRELVAIGFSNFFGSFFHTYPTFGSLPRSSVADGLGARSQCFTIVVCFILLITILVMLPLFQNLPYVAMTAIICYSSISLFKFADFAFLYRIQAKSEIFMLLLTFLLTVFLGIEIGVMLSLVTSIFLIIRRTTYPHISIIGYNSNNNSFEEISTTDSRVLPGIICIRIDDPLYFCNISQIKSLFYRIERLGDPKAHPSITHMPGHAQLRCLIIHARNILSIDASAVITLKDMFADYHRRNIRIAFVKLRESLIEKFISASIYQDRDELAENIFSNLHEAVSFIQQDLMADGSYEGYPYFNANTHI